MSTPGQDERVSLSQKRRREGVVKSNKHCNLTFKVKTRCYVSQKYHCGISTSVCCKILAPLSHLRVVCIYVNRQGIKVLIDAFTQSLEDILVSNVLRSARFFISFSLQYIQICCKLGPFRTIVYF